MSTPKRVRGAYLVALGAVVLVVLLALAWGHGGAGQVQADEPHAGLDFSIAVDGLPGCDTTGGDTTCQVPVGATFTIVVSLGSLPDDIVATGGYQGFDISLTYGGVTSEDNASFVWPDCVFGAPNYREGRVLFGCAIGVGAGPSLYTGPIGTAGFTCTEGESEGNTITLVHGFDSGNTALLDGESAGHAEAGTETLTIDCLASLAPLPASPTPTTGAAPPGTATAVPDGSTPTRAGASDGAGDNDGVSADGDGGGNAGLWIIIGVVLAVAAAALVIIGWRIYRRNR